MNPVELLAKRELDVVNNLNAFMSPRTLILQYSERCPHCHNVAVSWDKAADVLESEFDIKCVTMQPGKVSDPQLHQALSARGLLPQAVPRGLLMSDEEIIVTFSINDAMKKEHSALIDFAVRNCRPNQRAADFILKKAAYILKAREEVKKDAQAAQATQAASPDVGNHVAQTKPVPAVSSTGAQAGQGVVPPHLKALQRLGQIRALNPVQPPSLSGGGGKGEQQQVAYKIGDEDGTEAMFKMTIKSKGEQEGEKKMSWKILLTDIQAANSMTITADHMKSIIASVLASVMKDENVAKMANLEKTDMYVALPDSVTEDALHAMDRSGFEMENKELKIVKSNGQSILSGAQ